MSVSKITVSGQLVGDPEKRFTPENVSVTNFTMVVDSISGQRQNAQPTFNVKVACWRNLADAIAEELRQGDFVVVEGKLMINSLDTPDGLSKKSFEIEAALVHKLPGAPQLISGQAAAGGQRNTAYASVPAQASAPQLNQAQAAYSQQAVQQPAYAAAPQAVPQTAPQAVPAGQQQPQFTADELLTEDDIPF